MKRVVYTIILLIVTGCYATGQQHFIPVDTTGLPYIIVVDDVEIGTGSGVACEIGVFDDTLCVGAGIYDGINNAQITAWEGAPSLGLAGFTSGDSMTFKIWVEIDEEYQEVTGFAEYEQGDGTFGYGSYSVVILKYNRVMSITNPRSNIDNTRIYPNPFNHSSYIEYSFPGKTLFTITIFNSNGKKVFQYDGSINDKGRYIFYWNGKDNSGNELPSGVYLVSIRSSDRTANYKLTYLK